jgi:acyl-coenzyme A synthetase/AMP-(fatty) acid ligase
VRVINWSISFHKGEPINVEAWHWYNKVVGKEKCVVVDTWWQTETGGICISPRPSAPGSEIRPGMPMRPMYGIWPTIIGEKVRYLAYEFDLNFVVVISQIFFRAKN